MTVIPSSRETPTARPTAGAMSRPVRRLLMMLGAAVLGLSGCAVAEPPAVPASVKNDTPKATAAAPSPPKSPRDGRPAPTEEELYAQAERDEKSGARPPEPAAAQGAGGETAPKEPPNPEAVATAKLGLIKQLIADATDAGRKGDSAQSARLTARAAERLAELIKAYPDSKAAAEAKQLLRQLKPAG